MQKKYLEKLTKMFDPELIKKYITKSGNFDVISFVTDEPKAKAKYKMIINKGGDDRELFRELVAAWNQTDDSIIRRITKLVDTAGEEGAADFTYNFIKTSPGKKYREKYLKYAPEKMKHRILKLEKEGAQKNIAKELE